MVEDIGSFGGILKTIGNILGAVSRNVVDPSVKAEIFMHNSVQNISEKYVSDVNKTRWNTVK